MQPRRLTKDQGGASERWRDRGLSQAAYGQITDSMHGSMTAGQQLGSNAAHGPASDHMYGDASYDDLANATDRTLVNNTSWNRGQTANGGRAYAKQQAADLQAEWSATDRNPSPFSAPGRQAAVSWSQQGATPGASSWLGTQDTTQPLPIPPGLAAISTQAAATLPRVPQEQQWNTAATGVWMPDKQAMSNAHQERMHPGGAQLQSGSQPGGYMNGMVGWGTGQGSLFGTVTVLQPGVSQAVGPGAQSDAGSSWLGPARGLCEIEPASARIAATAWSPSPAGQPWQSSGSPGSGLTVQWSDALSRVQSEAASSQLYASASSSKSSDGQPKPRGPRDTADGLLTAFSRGRDSNGLSNETTPPHPAHRSPFTGVPFTGGGVWGDTSARNNTSDWLAKGSVGAGRGTGVTFSGVLAGTMCNVHGDTVTALHTPHGRMSVEVEAPSPTSSCHMIGSPPRAGMPKRRFHASRHQSVGSAASSVYGADHDDEPVAALDDDNWAGVRHESAGVGAAEAAGRPRYRVLVGVRDKAMEHLLVAAFMNLQDEVVLQIAFGHDALLAALDRDAKVVVHSGEAYDAVLLQPPLLDQFPDLGRTIKRRYSTPTVLLLGTAHQAAAWELDAYVASVPRGFFDPAAMSHVLQALRIRSAGLADIVQSSTLSRGNSLGHSLRGGRQARSVDIDEEDDECPPGLLRLEGLEYLVQQRRQGYRFSGSVEEVAGLGLHISDMDGVAAELDAESSLAARGLHASVQLTTPAQALKRKNARRRAAMLITSFPLMDSWPDGLPDSE